MSILAIIGILLLAGVAWWAIGALPIIPPPVKQVLYIILVVLVAGWLIGLVFGVDWGSLANIRIGR